MFKFILCFPSLEKAVAPLFFLSALCTVTRAAPPPQRPLLLILLPLKWVETCMWRLFSARLPLAVDWHHLLYPQQARQAFYCN